MRTVSFSQPKASDTLNNHFVNTFSNTYGDPTAGMSIRHQPDEPAGNCIRGNGKQNVQTIFMTPQGEIFHVATGFLSGEDLSDEAQFALEVFDEIKNMDTSDAKMRVADIHHSRKQNSSAPSNNFGISGGIQGFPKQGSGNRNMPDFSNMMAQFQLGQMNSDNDFSVRYPMMNYKDLEDDPAKLVGNGKSFFSSSSSSSNGQRPRPGRRR